LRLGIALAGRARGTDSSSLRVPDPWAGVLDLNFALALCSGWVLLGQFVLTAEAFGKRVPLLRTAAVGLTLAVLLWSARVYFSIRTYGATASDPFAYVQMGVDLAENGTLLHRFDLTPPVAARGLPLGPLAHVGYRTPDAATGEAATVWPPGFPAWLALAYRLGGETGLYVLAPLMGLLSLLAMGLLSGETLRRWAVEWRWLAAGSAILILATSQQQVERLAIPMADIPAQLFTTLALVFALRAVRIVHRKALFAALAGLCLSVAFSIRYTQVLLGAAILFLFFADYFQRRSRRDLLTTLFWFGVTAGLAALPVLWYHSVAFGGPFRVGSNELALFSLDHVPETFERMKDELFSAREFYWLTAFIVWGVIWLFLKDTRTALALLVWFLVINGFHLPYVALRLRDLLPQFPVLALCAGVGIVEMFQAVERIRRASWREPARIVVVIAVAVFIWVRSENTARLAFQPSGFNTFGLLNVDQRAAFDRLGDLLPPDAIVAVSLNSGPVGLYTGRDTVRPYDWSEAEWLGFIDLTLENSRPLYLLVDGVDMERPLEVARSRYPLTRVGSFPLPYFYPGGGSVNQQVNLYRLQPRRLVG
jgi:hypothetical protein